MRLARLTVRHFRNLAALDLELPEPGAVLIGENGQGKTNFLEAIYYLMLFRSLRGAKDRELVQFGEPAFFVGAELLEGGAGLQDPGAVGRGWSYRELRRVTAGYEVARGRKKVTLDGREVARLADAVGAVLAVPFSPADVAVVAGSPGARRRYLDVVLSVAEPGYLNALAEFRAALSQRNAALRRARPEEARAFDGPFARAASRVVRSRARWVAEQRARFAELVQALGEASPAGMGYEPASGLGDGALDADLWLRELERTLSRDARRGLTTAGPHRDEVRLTLAGREIRTYGSAGQQRTAAIALRVLEVECLARARGQAPIVLFDDVFAELDATRQRRLLALIQSALPGQAIVAAPREEEVPRALFDRPRWKIVGGQIVR